MSTDKSEAKRLADEAGNEIGKADPQWVVVDAAIEMLRRWPDGEPVAVVHWDDIGHISWRTNVMLADGTLLYTAPPDQSERIAALENDIHSCHPGCTRAGCVAEKLREAIEEQRRTIDALMCGMPDDGTTPVIRRIAALEAALAERDRVIEQARADMVRWYEAGYPYGVTASIARIDALRAIEEVQHG